MEKIDKFLNVTIEQDQDDIEPYTIIENCFIRDPNISTDCYWLISYLISNKPGWRICVRQIVNHKKKGMSRNKIYAAIKEAIELGYMKKEFLKRGNLNCGIKYIVSRTPKFKKCFRHSENGNPEDRFPENRDAKEQNTEYSSKEESSYKKKISKKASAEADRLSHFFKDLILKKKPNFCDSTDSWAKTFDQLLKIRSYDEIIAVCEFVVNSEFWWNKAGVSSPTKIKQKLTVLEIQMNSLKEGHKLTNNDSLNKNTQKQRSLNGEALNGQNNDFMNVNEIPIEEIETNKLWINQVNKKYFNEFLQKRVKVNIYHDHFRFINYGKDCESRKFSFNEKDLINNTRNYVRENNLI